MKFLSYFFLVFLGILVFGCIGQSVDKQGSNADLDFKILAKKSFSSEYKVEYTSASEFITYAQKGSKAKYFSSSSVPRAPNVTVYYDFASETKVGCMYSYVAKKDECISEKLTDEYKKSAQEIRRYLETSVREQYVGTKDIAGISSICFDSIGLDGSITLCLHPDSGALLEIKGRKTAIKYSSAVADGEFVIPAGMTIYRNP